MIIDKPRWVNHGTNPIWSIDIDPKGARVVTAGSDHKVRVWALSPILSAQAEQDSTVPKALASITDHLSAVNVARFSPKGHFIASGSDDKLVLVHQLMPGQGRAAFGSKETPNVENWRQVHSLRGHNSNISDIRWCPDGNKLASSSLDNNAIIWDAETGRQLAILSGHHGNVKGVAWDPFDHYIATQGDSDGVIIWSTADWSKVAHVTEPWHNSVATSAFHARPDWSPDGQTLAATNAFSKPIHQSPLVERNKWEAPHQLCGHKSNICVAKYNPRLFYSKEEGHSDEACGICALGSADRMFTVWTVNQTKPMAVLKDIFSGTVTDLAWTPDGQSLLACSYDGSIACATFNEQELGRCLPETDMAELLQKLYGEQQPKGQALLADAQLLSMVTDDDYLQPPGGFPSPSPAQPRQQAAAGAAAAAARAGAAAAAQRLGAANGALRPGSAAALDSRMGPGGAGFGDAKLAAGTRKRLAPTPVGEVAPSGPAAAPAAAGAAANRQAALAGPAAAAASSRPAATTDTAPAAKRVAPQPLQQARPAAAAAAPAAVAPAAQAAAAADSAPLLPAPPVRPTLAVELGSRQAPGATHSSQQEMLYLEAVNNLRIMPGTAMARVQCTANGRVVWFDTMQGSVVQLTGTLRYGAVSLTTGDLLVFSAAGRRLFPPIALGGPAAFMAHDDAWMLLVLTTDGRVRVWDLEAGACKLDVTLAPVLSTWHSEVAAVRLSSAGAPLVVLANRHAYTYLGGMQAWGRVADDSFPASQFHSSFAGAQGELGRVQSEAAAARTPLHVVGATFSQPADVQNRATRAHLESNVAAALALQSPYEWKRWLSSYVRLLAADGDEARLREVVHELLGPVRWTPNTHPFERSGWNPTILTYNKRQLLRNEVVREIARPRTAAMQALAQEALTLLKEADSTWPPAQQQQQQPLAGFTAHNAQQQQQQQLQYQGIDAAKAANGSMTLEAARGNEAQQEDRGVQQGHSQGMNLLRAATIGVTGVTPSAAAGGTKGGGGGMAWLQTGH